MAIVNVTINPWNESGTGITLSSADGIYMSTDSGDTVNPANTSEIVNNKLSLYVKTENTYACFFSVRNEGTSIIGGYIAELEGLATIGSVNVNLSEYTARCLVDGIAADSVKPVVLTFTQPAPPSGQHVSGLTVNGSTTSPASIAAGGTATIAYQYAADPPAEPVTLTFSQPEEGQNKVNQVRVSVDGGAASTASPVEIPAGSSAEVSYSYTPFDNYLGPNQIQPVSFDFDTKTLIITPVVDNLYYAYTSNITNRIKMNSGTEYRLKLFNNDVMTDRLVIAQNKASNYAQFAQAVLLGAESQPAIVGPHKSSSTGYVAIQSLYSQAPSTGWLIADTTDGVEVTVNHTDTTTPEVQ